MLKKTTGSFLLFSGMSLLTVCGPKTILRSLESSSQTQSSSKTSQNSEVVRSTQKPADTIASSADDIQAPILPSPIPDKIMVLPVVTPKSPPPMIPVVNPEGQLSGTKIVKNRATKFMAMGDSITAGHGFPGAYRILLQKMLTKSGFQFEFVGSQDGPSSDGTGQPQHEGYSGYRAFNIMRDEHFDKMLYGKIIDNAIVNFKPDVVLLHIGTNDVYYDEYLRTDFQAGELKLCIDQILKLKSNTKIIVAPIGYIRGAIDPKQIQILNTGYEKLVAAFRLSGADVVWAPQAGGGLNGSLTESEFDIPDIVHPSGDAHVKIANGFFNAISEETFGAELTSPLLEGPVSSETSKTATFALTVRHPRPVSTKWDVVWNPQGANVSFSSQTKNTTVTFSQNGTYQIRFSAAADGLTSYKDILVTVGGN